MPKATIDKAGLNESVVLPFELRISDFESAMRDVYDFFDDVNTMLLSKGLPRFDDMTRPAAMSGMLSDMITASLARFSRSLTQNKFFNGHPDLVVRGEYPNDCVASGTLGIEIKSTKKEGGAVDTHGARAQWMCVFVYETDTQSEPAKDRMPMQFTEVYLAEVSEEDFRSNARNTDKGTRTATLHEDGVKKLRENWIYKTPSIAQKKRLAAKAERDKLAAERREAKAAAKLVERTAKAAAREAAKAKTK